MKQSWVLILLISGLLALLVLLATAQYVWLAQISDAESERLHKRLQTDTQNFTEDFNKEIRGAYFIFQVDPGDWLKNDWTGFNDRYKLWQSQTEYPQLVKDFYFVGKDSLPIRYDPDAQDFKPTELTEELQEVRLKIQASEKNDAFESIVINTFTLLMPNFATGRETSVNENNIPVIKANLSGYLMIKLDEKVVNQLLATLRQRYFSDETTRYNLSISNKSDLEIIYPKDQNFAITSETSDASILLFDLSVSNFVMAVNSKVFSSNKKANQNKSQNAAQNPPLPPKMTKDDTVKVQMTDSQNAKSKEIESKGLWLLNVRHADGSLEKFIGNTQRKNLAISFGILGLLAISIILIFLSVRRFQVLAQRQVDFVSSVSHEFRTPLAVIYSAGENLADGVTKEEKQIWRYGNLIKGEGKKLSAMVEQILEFAGADSRRKRYNLIDVSVNEIVADAIAECDPLLKENGFTIEKEIAHDLPQVVGDKEALSRSIQNLITNSIKYGNGEKWLKVSAVNGGQTVKITVEDRGPGISKGDLRQIFEPFYRSKSAVDAQIHGNGLGLSIVRQIVEEHGGKVSAESEVGKGSRFIIELPIAKN